MVGRGRPKKKTKDDHTEDKSDARIFEELKCKLEDAKGRNDDINDVLGNLNKLSTDDGGPETEEKLKEAYENLEKTTSSQIDLLKGILVEIERRNRADFARSLRSCDNRRDLMKLISTRAHNLPLYCRSGLEVYPPQSVGAIPVPDTVHLEVGDLVAAYDDDDNWIIAQVVEKMPWKKYRVHDVDATPDTSFVNHRKYLIPMPKWKADPEHDPRAVFPVNAVVLAVFPQTTVFYRGIVVGVPSNSDEDYKIRFTDEIGTPLVHPVQQHHVVGNKDVSIFREEGGKNNRKTKKK